MQDCKVNILGTEWNIIFQTIEQDKAFADCDGYCDPTVKKIHVRLYTHVEFQLFKGLLTALRSLLFILIISEIV